MKALITKLLITGCLASASMGSVASDISSTQHFAPMAAGSSVKVDETNPYSMIRTVADITFKRFANEQAEIRKNPNLLKDIVREELVPYINYKYAAFKVIGGSNFRSTTEEERDEFVPVFRDYLVTSYAQVFTLYNNQKVEFEPERDFADEKVVAVRTTVIEPGRDPIDISFRVRKEKKTGEWKAYDMVAEGISLLDSKQAELSGLIRQKGLPHVTEMLREKANKDIVFK
ncbi:ABC transporter substrate-binding protein [Thalassotalea marina]|uniref:Toluene tolerance protein n=1 Tax=Thalassotalea marina TaxID=1673741 RepID=A0A919EGZ8_9GAMM|nr:ABC transporter substrate-binding protein [Thalassotalea marina]GHF78719.1 toluene tolerance protein [Thalassotalea marina]